METNKRTITGVKKRQRIQQANRAVFIWVTIAATIVAIGVVLSQFMVKQFLYNNKVIAAQVTTNDRLKNNIKAYDPLKQEVVKLIADPRLSDMLKADPADNKLQIIIDAMPTDRDDVAWLASLQQVVLARSGATIEGIAYTDVADSTVATPAAASLDGVIPVTFTFKATGGYDSIKKMLDDMQHSIRPISIQSVKLSGTSANLQAEIIAMTYYASPKTTDMVKEKVKP